MEQNWKRLFAQIASTIRAKQFLVFFAIALVGMDFATSILTSYLHDPRPLSDVLLDPNGNMYGLIRWPSFATALIVGAAFVLLAWLSCGYIRSLIGPRRFGPANVAQFVSMLLLLIAVDLCNAGIEHISRSPSMGSLFPSILQLLVVLLFLYADYAIVISGVDPARAIWCSLEAIGGNAVLSLSLVMIIALLQMVVQTLVDLTVNGGFAGSVGMVVLWVAVFGVVRFLSDVVLVCVYLDSIERRVLPAPRPARVGAAAADDDVAGDEAAGD